MLGLDGRTLRVGWTILVLALSVYTIFAIRHTIAIFALALFFAHLLAPVIALVQRIVPQSVSRTAALAALYIAMLGLLVAVATPIATQIAEQASGLGARLQATVQQPDVLSWLPLPSWLAAYRDQIASLVRGRFANLGDDVLPLVASMASSVASGLGNLLSAILIPILAFFFLKDGRDMQRAFLDMLSADSRAIALAILKDLHALLSQYIRALVLLSMGTFASHGTVFSLLGVPYPILLASIAAALEFIPVVGPLLSAVVALSVSGIGGYPHLLWIAAFLAVYRIFQDYVLSPYLMSSGVEVPPMLVLFGVLAGEQIAGIPGMFFSVPVIAALRILIRRSTQPRPESSLRDTSEPEVARE